MIELLYSILLWGVLVFGFIEQIDQHKSKARPIVVSDEEENAWHNYEFALKILLFGVCFFAFRVSLDYILFLPLIGALSLIVSDIFWNLTNKKEWWYMGDGKNEFFENLFTDISEITGFKYLSVAIFSKLFFVLIGILLLIINFI